MHEYADADDEYTPRDGDGGGYVGGSLNSYDLLLEVALESSEPVSDAISETLPDLCWVKKRFNYVNDHDAMVGGWEEFIEYVHCFQTAPDAPGRRYAFGKEVFGVETVDGCVDPGDVLQAIGELTNRLRLVKSLRKGTILYRSRLHRVDEMVAGVSELGPPHPDLVKKPGRMNRAGVAVFYGAFERITAIVETCGGGTGTVAQWETLRPLHVLDLTNLPPIPGFFHPNAEERHCITFFHGFAQDLRKEARAHQEEVDYLPSILVAEHYQKHFTRIDGIVYFSAKHQGGRNCVLFFGQDACVTVNRRGDGAVLRLLAGSAERIHCADQ